MDSQFAQQTQTTMTAPLSYFGFTSYSTGTAAQNAYQISPLWSDARLVGQFDTLQLFGEDGSVNAQVPLANGGAGPGLEPYTSSYPQYGTGGAAQLVPIFPSTIVDLTRSTVLPP